MGEWKTGALVDIAAVKMGQAPSGDSVNALGEGMPFLQGNAEFGTINPTEIYWCTQPRKTADIGNLLVSVRAPVGEINVADKKYCIGRGLAAIDFLGINKAFARYSFSKNIGQLHVRSQGTTFLAISKKDIDDMVLSYPLAPAEQSKIAEGLSATDEAIDKTRALVEKHRNIKAGLMQDLLINTNWAPGVFTDIADVNPRIAKGIQPLDEVDFIPMQDVNEYGVWDIKETRLAKNCMSGFTIFAENDVLFAKITPCMENGKGCIAEGLRCSIGFGSTEFHVLRAKANADPRFIYQWSIFPYLRQKAIAFMTGSAGQQRVSANFFAKLKIGIPQKPEQQRIAGILTTADEKIQTEQAYLAKLQDIKRGLMQDLLTNKVSVDALM